MAAFIMREPMPSDNEAAVAQAIEKDLLDDPQAGPAAIRGSFVRTGGYALGSLLSVISVPLLNRHLGFGDYGRYVTVISLVTIVQGITDIGLGQIGVREFALRGAEEQRLLMRNLLGVRCALTTAGVALATAFAAVAGYGGTVVLGTALAGVGMVLTVLQGTFAVPLAARLQLGWVTFLELARQALTVLAIVVLVLAGARLLPFLASTVPVAFVVLLATAAVARHAMPLRPSFDARQWSALLKAVLPFAAAVAIGALYLRITVVLMSLLASATQTGYYATSYVVVSVLIALPAMMVGATLPVLARAARDDRERLTYVLTRLFEVTLIVGVGLALGMAIGAEFVVRLLTGKHVQTPVTVLQIQSVALLTQFLASAWQYGLLAMHRHRALLVVSVVSLIASVALTFALVPVLDAKGGAIAFSAGELVLAACSYAMLRRAFPALHFGLRQPLRVLVAAGTGAAVALAPGLPSLPAALVATAIYLGALIAMKAIPPEILHAFRRPAPQS